MKGRERQMERDEEGGRRKVRRGRRNAEEDWWVQDLGRVTERRWKSRKEGER